MIKLFLKFKIAAQMFSISLVLSACSTSTVRIESQPEGADVYISVNGQSSKKVGQTPLNLSESSLGVGDQPFQLIVAKEGYQNESVLVPPTAFARSTTLQMKMKETASNSKSLNDQVLQKIASQTALIQFLIKDKNYDQAEQAINTIITQYPGVATFHELNGNVYYLRKDLSKALASYKRAYELNPSNADTRRMINKIENIRGERSSETGGL